ncbi:MAG: 23S rRNA (pseudouridine(1915)-N(3))-methyltransferase RlmH [Candidatus Peribacteraceae bacterium]|jgi:23S rRNA (pseudouridine1915-N3)-methyltransferase|nr:23S rRNA (pseudouridine(1915)-N(3))-methyltransferase RlmH [Candidatus Peribacteraceae bacterium]
MKTALVAIGTLKTPWAKEACNQYLGRLSIDLIELPASKQKDPSKQSQEESESILKRLSKMQGQVWVLDETGNAFTSESFARELEKVVDRGDQVIFVIGGAYGLTDAVRSRADRIIRLSDMTMAHELCRAVFLEQLYRAEQILKGTGYHH